MTGLTGLKPCPFCGCEMVLRPTLMCDNKTIRFIPTPKASENHGGLYQQHKRGCALDYASFIGYPTTEKGAKAKWNRRAESEEISDRVEIKDKPIRFYFEMADKE